MYHIIINANSRSGKGIRIWTTVKNELDNRHIDYICYFTKHKDHAITLTTQICEQNHGIKNIIVLGGDGTMNEVINGMTSFDDVILGYIPTGSSNDLARSLKLPKDPIECLNHILLPTHFDFLDIGVLSMNDKVERKFCVSTGVGFDASICEETFQSPLKKKLNKLGLGKLTYIIIALKQLFKSKFMEGYITNIDGTVIRYHNILLITSMIHKYEGGGMRISPKADPRDGKLSICLVHGLSRLQVLFLLPTLLFGKHTNFKGVESFDCNSLKIHLETPFYVHLDGECPGKYTDLKITCLPKRLRIIL